MGGEGHILSLVDKTLRLAHPSWRPVEALFGAERIFRIGSSWVTRACSFDISTSWLEAGSLAES